MSRFSFASENIAERQRPVDYFRGQFERAGEFLNRLNLRQIAGDNDAAAQDAFASRNAGLIVGKVAKNHRELDVPSLHHEAYQSLREALATAAQNLKTEDAIICQCRWVGGLGYMTGRLAVIAADQYEQPRNQP